MASADTRFVVRDSATHVVYFALPPLPTFMRPDISKCVSPSFHHLLTVWVLLSSVHVLASLLDADINGPATVGNVVEMFSGRIIAGFPAIESFVAKEACHAVGTSSRRFVVESGTRELNCARVSLKTCGGGQRA